MNRALLVQFGASAALGVVIAVGAGVVLAKPQIVSTAHAGTPVDLTGTAGNPLDFALAAGNPQPLNPLPPTSTIQLTSFHAGAATTAPDGTLTAPWWNKTVPRISAISQFDGGPLSSVNCLMTSGAMLARLGYGIVTTGSQVRALTDSPGGPTNYNDLQTAMDRGWGVHFFTGALTPLQLRALLYAGAGAVIDGVYGELPVDLRLDKDFTGRHAVYVDAFRPPGPDGPAAYYVMDPIGHTWEGYNGGWWPAEDVERFASQMGGGLIHTAWAFPGGLVPANHKVLPPDAYPSNVPPPSQTVGPSGTIVVTSDPMPAGSQPIGTDPVTGDPPPHPPKFPVVDFETNVFTVDEPGTTGCLAQPPPPGCPAGIHGIVDLNGVSVAATSPPRFDLKLLYANAVAPGTYQIIIDSPPNTDSSLVFWPTKDAQQLETATVEEGLLDGKVVSIATITLDPTLDYDFVATAAGDGTRSISPVGALTVSR